MYIYQHYLLNPRLTQNCQGILHYHFEWQGLYCRLEHIVYQMEILGTPWHIVDILETEKKKSIIKQPEYNFVHFSP